MVHVKPICTACDLVMEQHFNTAAYKDAQCSSMS